MQMPRYSILEHDWPERHWDLFLECDGVLKAWRLLAEPGPGRTVPAERAPDHRLLYLDYEGEVSGGRGRVRRWDGGEYRGQIEELPARLELRGERIRGSISFNGDFSISFPT